MIGREATPTFNLITESWIPVLRSNGKFQRVGIWAALTEAGSIRQIAASNPIDTFAVHRFLVTLLYWKANAAGGVEALRKLLPRGEVPADITNALNAESSRFDLFDAEQPFLQDVTASHEKPKSASSLFAEMSCGTNVAHFHHGDDTNLRLCLACATMGLLRLVPWTQSGGAGLSPAVHNAPPIMALACGRNLAETLGLNLVTLDGHAGAARWSGRFAPSDPTAPIPYMEALTWNPRRVHLGQWTPGGTCWRCGCRGVRVVGPIVYAKNDKTTLNKKSGKTIPFIWQDPSAFYESDEDYVTIKSYDEAKAASGNDLDGLLGRNGSRPLSRVLESGPEHRNWLLVVPCTNPANNKTYDHRQIVLDSLAPESIARLIPPRPPHWRQIETEGWIKDGGGVPNGSVTFVRHAVRLLTHADWSNLATAAYRPMHECPAAFDLLSGLLWPLRRRKVAGLPSRNVAWLVLKLMSAVPSSARVLRQPGGFCPLDKLAKRQLDERRVGGRVHSPYPVTLPRGPRLEAALRSAINQHLRLRTDPSIDWSGLSYRLNRLLD